MNDNVTTRRLFLQRGLALLAVTPTIPTFLDQTVMAMAQPNDVLRTQQASGKDGKILVVVQLAGGNDGLNMAIPYADDAYHRARPTLGVAAKDVLKLDDYVGLHPNMKGLKSLYDNGQMCVVQGVGYPNPNRSHFRATDIWESGDPEKAVETNGWLGRYFDNTCAGCDPHVGVAIGSSIPLAMHGDRVLPLSFERPESYRYNGHDVPDYLKLNAAEAAASKQGPASGKLNDVWPNQEPKITPASELDFLHRTAMDAQLSSNDILRMSKTYRQGVTYPSSEFGNSLRTVASLIAGGMPTRVYYVSLGGFDTHVGERGRHDTLMTQLSAGVSAFWADLKAQKNDDRVLMMTFSEFGRRVQQNASGGTDHGAAAPMLVFGKHLKSGLAGRYPSLTDLDIGDLKYSTDFRS
ncbi:MAG TPA: DUF1501 domain-containing protein, partial [Tepidisphaeraceae bacterium]|nr:DUF1501 domain-containing protein [Tepidisphaeraceae bacterium]